jgi:hypothetical protein
MDGIEQLVWNSLDADARSVVITLNRSQLDTTVQSVVLTDTGHGMSHDDALDNFEKVGGSWKAVATKTKGGTRLLHGRRGEGRLKAFAIGNDVEWTTVGTSLEGQLEGSVIRGNQANLMDWSIDGPRALHSGHVGTTVRITNPQNGAKALLADDAGQNLLKRFAVYLARYPKSSITYDGKKLNPQDVIERTTEIVLQDVGDGHTSAPTLTIIEWKTAPRGFAPSMLLCTEAGEILEEIRDGMPKASVPYTAYLTWPAFTDLENELGLADVHPVLAPVLKAARAAIRDDIKLRLDQEQAQLIEKWKAEDVYPYPAEPKTEIEVRERQIFNLVAATAAEAIPDQVDSAKLSLRLLRETLESEPASLHRVLKEVLNLTSEQVEDFASLLERTTLAGVIKATRMVTERIDFLGELEDILFTKGNRERLRERDELHNILLNGRLWVFGEENSLIASELGLTKLLREHIKFLKSTDDSTPAFPDDAIKDQRGKSGRVDLMLSGSRRGNGVLRHLVVELKRPGKVGMEETNQIERYADAVVSAPRKKVEGAHWDFWLVCTDMDEATERKVTTQRNRLPGQLIDTDTYTVWVKTWAQILDENNERLVFYRENLEYRSSADPQMAETLKKLLAKETVAALGADLSNPSSESSG